MNVKLRVLSAGALFFLGGVAFAQNSKKDTTKSETKIDEVVMVGYKAVSKKTAAVSTAQIKAETINNRPNANVMNVVQGQLAGVNITASSGQPGAKPQVIIRGIGTLYGNTDPLYVIDGFPTNSDSFRSLNNNDIESIEVLKDAAALAIYGNRGANGVVVIKTKAGSYGEKTVINYRSQIGVSILQKAKYNVANAKELLGIENAFGTGLGSTMTSDQIANYSGVDTNWNKVFFKPTLMQSHDLSITSGGKNLNSYTNFGYLEQEGILATTGLKRFSIRNTINGKSTNDKFKYTLGVAAAMSRNNQAPSLGTGSINHNYIIGAYTGAPYISPNQYQNSAQLFSLYQSDGTLLYTPLMLIDKQRTSGYLLDEIRVDINSEVSYKLTNDLTARTRINGQLLGQENSNYQAPISFNSMLYPYANGTMGNEGIAKSNQFHFNNLWQLEYSKVFADKHSVNVTGAFEFNSSLFKSTSQTQRGLNPLTWSPWTGAGYIPQSGTDNIPQISSGESRLGIVSFFATADYNFEKKYGVVANVRRDGTSRFADGYKWGTFWSVGGFWNVDEESFMDNVSWVSLFKLRGSYGTVGNQRIVDGTIWAGLNPPRYLDSYGVGTTAGSTYNGGSSSTMLIGYPKLQWEVTKQWNVGTDFELFKNRLRGQFDVYQKKSIDIFYDWKQSALLGQTSITQNTGINIYNKGLELSLAYDVIRNQNVRFTLRGNGSMNKSKVENLDTVYDESNVVGLNGYPWMVPYVYHYLGVNPSNGNLLFEDINGNPTEKPTLSDRRALEYNTDPKYQGGFGFDFSYKGLFLNSTFTYVAKYYRFDYDMSGLYDPGNIGQFNVSSDLLNAWTPTNTGSNIPSLTAGNYNYQDYSDRFLVDASYIRLRNIQFGYKLPKSVLENTFVKDLSVFVQAENLVTWSKWRGFDAESPRGADQYQYPTPKSFTIGLDVKF